MPATRPANVVPCSLNYALGFAEGLAFRRRRRNQPTADTFREEYELGVSDAVNGLPFRFDQEQRDEAPAVMVGAGGSLD